MANYNGSAEAVDRPIYSVRYDMVLESIAGCRRPSQMPHQVTYDYDQPMLEPCERCCYTFMANYNGSSGAVDRHIHSVRYVRYELKEYCRRPSQMPHQVNYNVVATPIRPTNA
eukprot:scaffold6240_cov92-Skeletonema_dohrnii-CCMP3373.AAC.1